MSVFGPIPGQGSAFGLVARSGDAAPGAANTVLGWEGLLAFFCCANLDEPMVVLNDVGDMAFRFSLAAADGAPLLSDVDSAIFAVSSGAGAPVTLVAREGDSVLNRDEAFVIGNLLNAPLAINNRGDVAFVTTISRLGESADDRAYFASYEGRLELVVHDGQEFQVLADGMVETRIVERVATWGAFSGLKSIPFNDVGTLPLKLSFTDGSSGIFTAQLVAVPEPSPLASLALMLVVLKVANRCILRAN